MYIIFQKLQHIKNRSAKVSIFDPRFLCIQKLPTVRNDLPSIQIPHRVSGALMYLPASRIILQASGRSVQSAPSNRNVDRPTAPECSTCHQGALFTPYLQAALVLAMNRASSFSVLLGRLRLWSGNSPLARSSFLTSCAVLQSSSNEMVFTDIGTSPTRC